MSLLELGFFPHISAASFSKSEFLHFPETGSRGREESMVLLLGFFQVSTSVLPDVPAARLPVLSERLPVCCPCSQRGSAQKQESRTCQART